MIHHIKKITLITLIMLALPACGAGILQTADFKQPYYFAVDPEAKIPDTDENFQILQTVQQYRDAIANKDVATLRDMVSSDYYENASTTDDLSDDYGNERIEEILNDYLAQSVKDIRFIIEVKALSQEGLQYHVDFQYIWNYRYEVAGQSYWQSKNDTNRMTIVREHAAWTIKTGLYSAISALHPLFPPISPYLPYFRPPPPIFHHSTPFRFFPFFFLFSLFSPSRRSGYVLTSLRAYAYAAVLCAHYVARIRTASSAISLTLNTLRSFFQRAPSYL